MEENKLPEAVLGQAADVEIAAAVEEPVAETEAAEATAAEESVNLSDKNLAELSEIFQQLRDSADSMLRSKEAEAIKSAFYKLLLKLKSDIPESAANPFEAVEENFKALYADYKKDRAEYNRRMEQEREENLEKKKLIIEDLKALVEGQEDVSASFPAFREIQNRWRDAGQVPVGSFRDINDTYQFYVEKFYDMVKINRDLRDLDFRKNLEAKEELCAAAEKLVESSDVVTAFRELQKLHEQWKEYGPVAKEKREEIWERFKAATAEINKKYQAHFEGLKEVQTHNLEEKKAICEEIEAILEKEITSSSEWNTLTEKIGELQEQWRKIGFATKKENQKIYDRFRAACDKFFERKREYYSDFKQNLNRNLEAKKALVARANELKTSTEWKQTTEAFIELQKEWKQIGSVPRKKSDELWKEFRAACDEFFAERAKHAVRRPAQKPQRPVHQVKDSLMDKYRALQQDIATYENNIGFFAASKNSEPLIKQMQNKIDKAKEELKKLENQIRKRNEEGEE
ncbi:MAG: DUF349 domain-containing protein [Bacteroidales bacterium]|nr:DUF349 domain-containing protein [Bacteroidales bacterium]